MNDEEAKNNEDSSKPPAATEDDEDDAESAKSESASGSHSMAQEATDFWINHKQDIKKFREWKMMQKMVTRVVPTEEVDESNMEEVEIASRMVEGFDQTDMDQGIYPPPMKRLHSVPNPKTSEAKTQKSKVSKDNRQRKERDWKFIQQSTFKFYLQGNLLLFFVFHPSYSWIELTPHCRYSTIGGKFQNESFEGQGIEWREGYIYCTHCEVYIKRAVDIKQHCKSRRHQNKLKALQDTKMMTLV